MKDKAVKIGNELIEPDSKLYNYIHPPCSWRYHRCNDFPNKCYQCNRNKDLWKEPTKKKSHSYFTPIWEHYH